MTRLRELRRLGGVLVGTGVRAAPRTALACLLLGLAAAACSVLYTIGLRVTIDGALAHDRGEIVVGAILVAGLFTASWLFAVIGASRGSLLTDRASLALGVEISRRAAGLPTLEHFEAPELLARLERVTAGRRTLAGAPRQLIGLAGQALRAIGMIVLLGLIYPPVLLVPVLALFPAFADRRAAAVTADAEAALAEDRRRVQALFEVASTAASARELRTYGLTEALPARHGELADRVRRRAVRAAGLAAAWEAAGWLVFAAGLVAAIVILVLRAAHGEISPGAVVEAVTLMRRAQTQISRTTDTAGSFGSSLGAARELLWLRDREPAAGVAHRQPVPARLRSGIELRGVRFAYPGSSRTVLGPLDLTLPAGATVALLGDNGAGKTTLVKLLCGMYAPSAGEIIVDGEPLEAFDVAGWRARVSAAFQDFVRFQLTLGESVGVGDLPRAGDPVVVADALRRSGAERVAERLPDGLDTHVGTAFTGGRELSGGEWQRLALARGLMRADPLLVVLDEPTASLDPRAESALFERYRAAAHSLGARHGTVTLLVSHRFSTARAADLIVVLSNGRVVETGSHESLLRAGGEYAELFAAAARGYA